MGQKISIGISVLATQMGKSAGVLPLSCEYLQSYLRHLRDKTGTQAVQKTDQNARCFPE